MSIDDAEVLRWREEIAAHPDRFRLPAYGPWTSPERAAALWARWAGDERDGQPASALCRRCGHLLTGGRPAQQLHPYCEPLTSWSPWYGPTTSGGR